MPRLFRFPFWILAAGAAFAVTAVLAAEALGLEIDVIRAQILGVKMEDIPLKAWSLIRRGGPAMYPILLCSILALGVFLERSVNLRRKRIIHQDFLSEIRRFWIRRDVGQALQLCWAHDISISRILRAGLIRHRISLADMERAIEAAGQHEIALLTSNLRALGVVANLTPMLGLLGTVIGMIKAFTVISQSGTGNPGLVASGISEALLTTAAGLIVGIPSLAAYHYFRAKIDRYVYEMEHISLEILEDVYEMENISQEILEDVSREHTSEEDLLSAESTAAAEKKPTDDGGGPDSSAKSERWGEDTPGRGSDRAI